MAESFRHSEHFDKEAAQIHRFVTSCGASLIAIEIAQRPRTARQILNVLLNGPKRISAADELPRLTPRLRQDQEPLLGKDPAHLA
eukprot:CAMPEP_0180803416 /NCGR_PEP_ID=MMETSP1038_2-20121128/60885_1 /TAXON_ID=632150 /ORGANISM="Azadinium spinosum, Strain 3D9" /LENGTH=84 /DNA_ID=CAMNT_0022843729 /DNA_START=473 /DNA_END=723 /DNA_ORIENTATION=-